MTDETAVIVHEPRAALVQAEDFLPVLSVDQAVQRKAMMNEFIGKVLREDSDYGSIPGAQKKVLLKPGAEKLCSIFGFAPFYQKEVIVEDWTGNDHGGEPLFSYEYRCQLYRGSRCMGEAIGSCNTWESKYRYRWVTIDVAQSRPDFERLVRRGGQIMEPRFAIDKGETTGKYGKPAAHWQAFRDAMKAGTASSVEKDKKGGGKIEFIVIDSTLYRVPNPDMPDIINTVMKMAQKRALVAAVLVVTNCSDAFTQDVEPEDLGDHGDSERIVGKPVGTKEAQAAVRDEKLKGSPAPTVIPFEALDYFKTMKKELGEPLYRYALKKFGFDKSNKITTDKLALVQKTMGKYKIATDSLMNGEWPKGITAEVFACVPDGVQSSYQIAAKRELVSLLGEDLGLDAFEEHRLNEDRFLFSEALAKDIETLRAQQRS